MIKSIASAVALTLLAGSAMAAPATAVVHLGKLNPTDANDARTLDRRLEKAAMKVCGGYEGSVSEVRRVVARSECFKETFADARAKLQARTYAAK